MLCKPRIAVVPDQVKTAGPQMTRLAAMGGIRFDEAQRFVADATAGVGADGKWAAFESVIYAPRQNLKTEFLIARILAGLFLFREELIVFSAHRSDSTTKVFGRLKRAIDRSPHLGARIERVSNRPGSEQIRLTTGQMVQMVARSTNSGRGFTGDTVILDEAHELSGDELAGLLPMLSTKPNPAVIYALSMADDRTSHVSNLRSRALAGDPGVCWLEWSMDPDDRIDDRRVWVACNPAFHAGRISMKYLEDEYRALGPERFARERLGFSTWPSGDPGEWQVIDKDMWEAGYAPDGSLGPPPELVVAGPRPEVAAAGPVPASRPPWERWPLGIPPWIAGTGLPGGFGVLAVISWDHRGACRFGPQSPVSAAYRPYTGVMTNEY